MLGPSEKLINATRPRIYTDTKRWIPWTKLRSLGLETSFRNQGNWHLNDMFSLGL